MSIRFSDPGPKLSEDDLCVAERRLGFVLPVEYRQFLLTQNGGVPTPNNFRFADRRDSDDEMRRRPVHLHGGKPRLVMASGQMHVAARRASTEIKRFFSVGGKGRFAQLSFDLEASRQDLLADWSLPEHLLPIALVDDEVSGGVLCVSLATLNEGQISYVAQDEKGECAVYHVADSLSALFDAMAKRKRKSPAWIQAIDDGDVEAVRRWLDEGGSLSETYQDVITPMDRAVQEGQLDIVKLLMERGGSMAEAYEHAVAAGRPDILRYLLSLPEGQRCAAREDFMAFRGAASDFFRDVDLLRQLIALGATINRTAGSDYAPLHLVAGTGTPEALRLFLDNGARPNEWSESGELALHRAIFSRTREEMLAKMKMLIDMGEELHARAPLSALSERVRKTAERMQVPNAMEHLNAASPELAAQLKKLRGGSFEAAVAQRGGAYLAQYQRTAAEVLAETRGDPAALEELAAYQKGRPR